MRERDRIRMQNRGLQFVQKQVHSNIISVKEAFDQGYTPESLRILANCLESKARRTEKDQFFYVADEDGNVAEGSLLDRTHNFNPELNRKNAERFRALAMQMERILKGKGGGNSRRIS